MSDLLWSLNEKIGYMNKMKHRKNCELLILYEQNEISQELRIANINVYLAETFVLLQGRAQSDLVRTTEIMPLMAFPLMPDIRLGCL